MHKSIDIKAQDLDFILVLYRKKTLTEAAKYLGLEQSTLSRQLTQLEERLGATLFARHRRGLTPGPLALELLPHAERMEVVIRNANHATAVTSEQPVGEVTISCADAIADRMLAPLLGQFMSEHPHIRLKIMSSVEIVNLDRLDCDIALRLGVRPEGDAIITKLSESRIIPFGHPKFLPTQGRASLADLPILHRSEMQSPDSRQLQKNFPQSLLMLSNRMTTCILAAEQGAGVVFLPEAFGKRVASLVAIPVSDWDPPTIPLYLAAPRVVRKLKHVDATWTWIKKMF